MQGQRPIRVTAVTQQLKPEVYPQVDDDATIILTYPHAQGIIQASWNWPIGRKDMDIYGVTGAVKVADRNTLQLQTADGKVHDLEPPPLDPKYREPIAYFAAVVRGEIPEHPLSSLETNVIVTESWTRRACQHGPVGASSCQKSPGSRSLALLFEGGVKRDCAGREIEASHKGGCLGRPVDPIHADILPFDRKRTAVADIVEGDDDVSNRMSPRPGERKSHCRRGSPKLTWPPKTPTEPSPCPHQTSFMCT